MPITKLEVLLILRDQLTAGINGVSSRMKRFGESFRRNWLAIGASIFLVKRAIDSLINPSIEFESAFAGVKKTVDATNAEFKQLEENLLNMSRRIPVAAKELAGIQEIAGQLGIKGVKNLTKFTEAIAKISVSTNLSQQSAAINFSRIASVINEPIENIEKMASSVVELGNNFEVQEDEILNFAQRIAAMGKLAKLTTADLFGVSAAFASVGVRAEAGGTAVNKVLLSLAKQGKTGSKALIDFIDQLQASGDKAAQKLEELGFKEARTQRAFLSLAGAGDKLEVALRLANDEFARGTALNIEAAKRFETTSSKVQLIKNNITILQKEIGDKLIPAFEKLLIVTKKYVDFATGEDLKQTKLELLNEALKKIDNTLSGRGGDTEGFFGALGGFEEETRNIERRRTVLVGLIHEEKNRLQLLEETALKEQELASRPVQGAPNKIEDEIALEANKVSIITALHGKLTTAIIKFRATDFADAKSKAAAKAALQQQILNTQLGNIEALLAQQASSNKAAAIAFKAIQIGRAIINTHEAVTEALPNIPLAVLVAAMGAVEIALIASQKFHKGGMIRAHNGLAVGEVPIIAQTGEGILSRSGVRNLGGSQAVNDVNAGRGGGGGGDIFVEINNPRMSTKDEVQSLVRTLGLELERQLRYARSI